MVLTTSDCGSHLEHALGGPLQGQLSASRVINETGQVFVNLAQWKFLERSQVYLNLRGTITVLAGTWNEPTLTLTATSPANTFLTYTLLAGDDFEVTGGTGANPGFYRIVSKTTATLVLASSIGAAGSDVTGTITPFAVALPPDFREVIALRGAASTNHGVHWTTHEQMLASRAWGTGGGASSYLACLSYAPVAATASGPPVPRLEILGSPTENETGGLLLSYRAGWTYVSDDQQFIAIPPYCEPLFIQLLRAYAKGLEEDDLAPMEQRIRGIKASDMYQDALSRDRLTQPSYGALLHGALSDGGWPYGRTLSSQVAAPSSL